MSLLFQIIFWTWIVFYFTYIIGMVKDKEAFNSKLNLIIFTILSLTFLIIIFDIEDTILSY